MHTSLSLLHRSGLSTHHVTYSKVCIPDSTGLKTFDTIVAVKLSRSRVAYRLATHRKGNSILPPLRSQPTLQIWSTYTRPSLSNGSLGMRLVTGSSNYTISSVVHLVGGHSPPSLEIASLQCIATIASINTKSLGMYQKQSPTVLKSWGSMPLRLP